MLPLDHFSWGVDLDKFVGVVVEEIEGETVAERVVGEKDTV